MAFQSRSGQISALVLEEEEAYISLQLTELFSTDSDCQTDKIKLRSISSKLKSTLNSSNNVMLNFLKNSRSNEASEEASL